MMFDTDPQTQAMVSYRQQFLLAEASRCRVPRHPSALRVAIGIMLIHLGEQMRGRAQQASSETAQMAPDSRLRPAAHP